VPINPRGLIFFGLLIGVLTALSTAAGTTATLIGLLFAVIGGSFLTWFRPGDIDSASRNSVVLYSGHLGGGAVLGLLLGFGLRALDQGIIQPWATGRNVKVLQEATGPGAPKLPDAVVQDIAKKVVERIGPTATAVRLQAAAEDELTVLSESLRADAANSSLGLSPEQRAALTELATAIDEHLEKRMRVSALLGSLDTYGDKLSETTRANLQSVRRSE
jgi:hypothetical protein